MILVVVRQWDWTAFAVAKELKWESENDSRQPRDPLKNRQSDSPKKVIYSFSWDADEEKWWRWGENHCAVTELCNSKTEHWGIFPQGLVFIALPSYQQRGGGGGGQEIDSQVILIDGRPLLGFQLPTRPPLWQNRVTILELFCDKEDK